MELTIDLQSILMLVLIVLVIAVVLFVFKLVQTMKGINTIIETNEKNINDTLNSIPIITKNIEEVTSGINDEMENITGSIENVSSTIDTTTDLVDTLNQEVLQPLLELGAVLMMIKDFIPKKKKKGLFK